MPGILAGRIGIVTGASSGIGFTTVNMLAEAGAYVYAISRSGRPKGEGAYHQRVTGIRGDVTDYAAMEQIVQEIGDRHGIDFLINNAGITVRKRAELFSDEDFDRIHKVNVYSVFKLSCLCYPYLKESKHVGRIINIASMAAYQGFSEVVPYCSSKAAVLGLTRGLAVEWRSDNILVNSVSPGWFPSELTRGVMDPERKAKILNKIPLGRFGDPAAVGAMIRFLLSDDAVYITGQDLAVDGGALTYGF
ncbi:MAG TPA: SDR family oxidoreductase [Firmicutes bacterium]|nr:SDR family oxidoreductase [Bacillota bacterium]